MLKFLPPLHEIKFIGTVAYYLAANFVIFYIPFLLYGAYQGNLLCRLFLAISLVDYMIPLRPGPKGRWNGFIHRTNWNDGIHSYLQGEFISECRLEDYKNTNYCVCYFPHSLFGIGYGLLLEHFQDEYGIEFGFTGAEIIFQLPIIRRLMTWWGLTGVSAKALKTALTQPYPYNAVMLQPDGIAGMFYGLQHEQVVLHKRKGFCRIALQTGCTLIPCYALGANDLFTRKFDHCSWAARLSHKLHVSLVVWTDAWGIPWGPVPHRVKMVVVLGKPIQVQQAIEKNPSKEQIEELHATFVKELKALYDRHKHRLGSEWEHRHPKLYLESEEPEEVMTDAQKKTK